MRLISKIDKHLVSYYLFSDGITPLMAVCLRGQTDVAKLLLDSGASITAVEKNGWSMLL